MDIQRFVKLAVGNEWLTADEKEMHAWVESKSEILRPKAKRMLLADLRGRKIPDIAAEEGITQDAVWKQVSGAIKMLGAVLKFDESIRLVSVFEHEFSESVDWIELAKCLYGKPSRSLFWYVRKTLKGETELPMPEIVNGKYVWTREQAEEWRRFYVHGKQAESD